MEMYGVNIFLVADIDRDGSIPGEDGPFPRLESGPPGRNARNQPQDVGIAVVDPNHDPRQLERLRNIDQVEGSAAFRHLDFSGSFGAIHAFIKVIGRTAMQYIS